MKHESNQLLEKAERAIRAAQHLQESGDLEFAIGRAYYAMFYIAEALLNEKGLRFRKHSGVHSAFGEHYIKTGILDPQFHRWLLAAFNHRITSDYGLELSFTEEDVQEIINHSQQFLVASRIYLESHR